MKKIFVIAILILIVSLSMLPTAFAETETVIDFDTTDVLDDLTSSTTNGESFDINKYPFNANGKLKLITFVEYCYTVQDSMSKYFGLYLYLYNPTAEELNISSASNKVQLGVATSTTTPYSYAKYPITCVSKSTGDYANLFYKFKINVSDDFMKSLNSNSRAYSVSGIELSDSKSNSVRDHKVAGKFTFSGYAKKCGIDPGATSSLECAVTDIETISLNVKELSYTSKASSDNHLQSVAFNVPNKILNKYGKLDKIECEWYEYKTKDMIVTSDHIKLFPNLYSKLEPQLGVKLDAHITNAPTFSVGRVTGGTDIRPTATYDWAYNIFSDNMGTTVKDECNVIYIAFDSGNVDPFDYTVPSELIKSKIKTYKKSYDSGRLTIKNGAISNDLFLNDVDAGRTRGYNHVVIDSDGMADLFQDSSQTWWDKLFNKHNVITKNAKPLMIVDPADFTNYNGTDDQIKALSDKYLVDKAGVETLAHQINDATIKDCTTYDMRIAVTDTNSVGFDDNKGYKFSQTVLLDFDIITLTFSKDGTPTLIPVVSNPIDIAGDVPPADKPGIINPDAIGDIFGNVADEFKKWLTIILIALGIIILSPVLKYVFIGIGWIVRLPFQALKKTSNKVNSAKPKAKKQNKGSKSEADNARERFK